MKNTTYAEWFSKITGDVPHEWQRSLGEDAHCRERMIRIPTGFGKTAGVVLAWLHHRVEQRNETWPRRLVFCLPMRVLVEQTEHAIKTWLVNSDRESEVGLHVLMGGVRAQRWVERPELTEMTGPSTRPLVESCLFAKPASGALDTLAGQFFPAGNGGTNAGAGFSGKATANEWDYVLAVEGAVLFAGAAARRLDASTSGAAFPFAVRVDAAGYASAADADREASRSEVWLPLWAQPTNLSSVQALLGEGRIRVDRADARRTTDVVRAIASLGTSRGIGSFERTAFFTRNGNMHYSAPLGRWDVTAQPRTELLDDISPWVREFAKFARDKLAPKAITSAARAIDEAILGVCRAGSGPPRWQALLAALGRAERALLRSPNKVGDPKRKLSPLPPVSVKIDAV